MTNRHYKYAADTIVEGCLNFGINKEENQAYDAFVNFFEEMSFGFDRELFDKYIDKKLEEVRL
jgi:hypothetical protein